MSRELIAKLKKAREVKVTIGKFTFTARRPTDVEAIALHRGDGAFSTIAQDFVIGWDGVTEDDIIGGGGSDPFPFAPELWREWCADRPDLWGPISNACLDAYREHAEKLTSIEKN
jgi:hypothetical protein